MSGALPFISLHREGFFAVTSTRQGGLSQGPYLSQNLGLHVQDDALTVRANRKAFFASRLPAGVAAVCLEQVHGDAIAVAGPGEAHAGWDEYGGSLKGVDGAVTAAPGLALAIGHADCLALVAVDFKRRACGAAHAGWRGALAGMPAKLVRRLAAEFGSEPGELWVGLSPNLHPCCLRLGPEQLAAFTARWGAGRDWAERADATGFSLSLNRLARQQLLEAGVREERIEIQSFCTGCNPALFYSHRRDRGVTGRMWTVAGFTA